MKTLKQHIDEALKIGKNLSEWSSYSCQPKTYRELEHIVNDRIEKEGPNCDLNDIDTSLITDMSELFFGSEFNGDSSKWNVSNVKNMEGMFCRSWFDDDISDWDVSNVENMSYTFSSSKFNQDISKWKIRKDCRIHKMFDKCPIKSEYKPKLPR